MVLNAPVSHKGARENVPDPQAAQVAKRLREAVDAECVILFGSRARGDHRPYSDLDLIVITEEPPDKTQLSALRDTAWDIIRQTYNKGLACDLVCLTPADYNILSRHTLNHVAGAAWEEGVFMARNPAEYGRMGDGERRDSSQEWRGAVRRIADTNAHYDTMQILLDIGIEDLSTVNAAAMCMEHGMKALISILGHRHPTHHDLERIAEDIARIDPSNPLTWASNLEEMGMYSGGDIYGEISGPKLGFDRMADDVTQDITRMYDRIEELTGESPWSIATRVGGNYASPKWREAPP